MPSPPTLVTSALILHVLCEQRAIHKEMLGGGLPKKGCLTSTLGILHDSAAKTKCELLGSSGNRPRGFEEPMRHRDNQTNGLLCSLLPVGNLLFW
jgi:hypothetical protein